MAPESWQNLWNSLDLHIVLEGGLGQMAPESLQNFWHSIDNISVVSEGGLGSGATRISAKCFELDSLCRLGMWAGGCEIIVI